MMKRMLECKYPIRRQINCQSNIGKIIPVEYIYFIKVFIEKKAGGLLCSEMPAENISPLK